MNPLRVIWNVNLSQCHQIQKLSQELCCSGFAYFYLPLPPFQESKVPTISSSLNRIPGKTSRKKQKRTVIEDASKKHRSVPTQPTNPTLSQTRQHRQHASQHNPLPPHLHLAHSHSVPLPHRSFPLHSLARRQMHHHRRGQRHRRRQQQQQWSW